MQVAGEKSGWNRNDLRSQSLDLLRFPLAIVILVIHVFNTDGLIIQGHEYNTDHYPVFIAINRFIDAFFRGQSVPIYFFISGFVFFLGVDFTQKTYAHKLKNRVHTLLIPYIIWNSVALLLPLIYFLPCFSSIFPNIHKVDLNFSLSQILPNYWNSTQGFYVPGPEYSVDSIYRTCLPVDPPLWFVRDLMIVVLCTPLLYRLLKWTRCYAIWILGVLWFFSVYSYWPHLDQLLFAFFFFSWGAYMSVNGKDMLEEFGRFFNTANFLYPLLALVYVAATYYWPEAADTVKRLNIVVGLIFGFNLSCWLLKRGICKVNRFLASSSFFIYVTHMIICGMIVKGVFYLIRPESGFGVFLVYVLAVCITITILLVSFFFLRRYTPALLQVLTGRK